MITKTPVTATKSLPPKDERMESKEEPEKKRAKLSPTAMKCCGYCGYSTHSKDELVEHFKDVHVARMESRGKPEKKKGIFDTRCLGNNLNTSLLWIDLMDGNAPEYPWLTLCTSLLSI